MKVLVSIQQKEFADKLIEAGFTRKEVAQALQDEFKITYKHATVLVYRWYVGTEFKVTKEEKAKRVARLPYSRSNIERIQAGDFNGKGAKHDKNGNE